MIQDLGILLRLSFPCTFPFVIRKESHNEIPTWSCRNFVMTLILSDEFEQKDRVVTMISR